MAASSPPPLLAVDIGNTRTKLGLFRDTSARLPQPERTLALETDWRSGELARWLGAPADAFCWRIASVNRMGAARLQDWLRQQPAADVRMLGVADYPRGVEVAEPDQVGMDRLANALGADGLRELGRAAIVVDLGSAITVDLVSAQGAFLGGAILPGIAMSARALHEFTDLLPLEPMSELADPPDALGKTTIACLRAGLYWGAIGGVRELVGRLNMANDPPQLFVTGGAGVAAARLLKAADGKPAELVPHLTLAGVAMMGRR